MKEKMQKIEVPKFIEESVGWLCSKQDYRAAHVLIQSLENEAPKESADHLLALKRLYQEAKSYEKAVDLGLQVVKQNGVPVDFAIQLILELVWLGKLPLAQEIFRSFSGNLPAPLVCLMQSLFLTANGKIQESNSLLRVSSEDFAEFPKWVQDLWLWLEGLNELGKEKSLSGLAKWKHGRSLGLIANAKEGRDFKLPNDLTGARVLVLAEGSTSEELGFSQLAMELKFRGAEVHWFTNLNCSEMMSWHLGIDRVHTSSDSLSKERFDFIVAEFDLPEALGKLPSLNEGVAFLRPPADERARFFANRMNSAGLLKVGVSWLIERERSDSVLRSMNYIDIQNCCRIPGVRFFALQRDEGFVKHPAVDFSLDLKDEIRSLSDLVKSIAQLDMVVGANGLPAMIARALGVKVAVAEALFPSAVQSFCEKPFCQTQYGDWSAPVEEIREHLRSISESKKPNFSNEALDHGNLKWYSFPFSDA